MLMRLKTQPGDPYDPKAINKELKNIYDLGYFEDIEISMEDAVDGKHLVITVKKSRSFRPSMSRAPRNWTRTTSWPPFPPRPARS